MFYLLCKFFTILWTLQLWFWFSSNLHFLCGLCRSHCLGKKAQPDQSLTSIYDSALINFQRSISLQIHPSGTCIHGSFAAQELYLHKVHSKQKIWLLQNSICFQYSNHSRFQWYETFVIKSQKNQLKRKECNAAQVLYLHIVSSYTYISYKKNLFVDNTILKYY